MGAKVRVSEWEEGVSGRGVCEEEEGEEEG